MTSAIAKNLWKNHHYADYSTMVQKRLCGNQKSFVCHSSCNLYQCSVGFTHFLRTSNSRARFRKLTCRQKMSVCFEYFDVVEISKVSGLSSLRNEDVYFFALHYRPAIQAIDSSSSSSFAFACFSSQVRPR